ncbi:MAG: tetratricopeptide repeat protein [Candidatus Omnitrophota bacterium]
MNNLFSSQKNIFVMFLLGMFCLAAYSNSLNNPFLMDDHALILQNRKIGDLGHLQLNPFSHQKKNDDGSNYIYYRPITHLADYISFLMFEKNVFGYHALNLLLFFICSVILYHFLNKINIHNTTSIMACLFFVTHPVNGVLINYTSTTGYILLIIFTLLGFIQYLTYTDDNKISGLCLSLLFFCLSILCHETAIFFPIYLAAILYFLKNHKLLKVFISLLPFLAIIALYLLFRMHYASLKSGVLDNIPGFGLSVQQYAVMYFLLILSYIKNLLFMTHIVLIYSAPVAGQNLILWMALFIFLITVLVYLIFFKWRTHPKSLALAWMVIGFGPVTLACFSRPSMGMIISPHWLLISSIGYCLLIALLFETLFHQNHKRIFTIVTVFLLFSYVFISRQYNRLWSNEIQYCRYMLKLSPDIPLVKFWLANAYFEKGEFENAKRYFKTTIMGVENDWKAYTNLGVIEGLSGNKDMELKYYLKALEQKPDSTDLLNNIAAVLIEQKEFSRAESILKNILTIDPHFKEAHNNLELLNIQKKAQDNN